MGMSSRVVGIRMPDAEWFKNKAIIDALEKAGYSYDHAPDNVLEFFNHERPDDKGITIRLGSDYGELHECCEKHREDMEDGYVIDISKLPKNITHIRFINSY